VHKPGPHKYLRAAYLYYCVNTKTPLPQLFTDALVAAKQLDFDVMNALDTMHYGQHFKDLRFMPGSTLHYYLYNWRCPEMTHSDVALVLL